MAKKLKAKKTHYVIARLDYDVYRHNPKIEYYKVNFNTEGEEDWHDWLKNIEDATLFSTEEELKKFI